MVARVEEAQGRFGSMHVRKRYEGDLWLDTSCAPLCVSVNGRGWFYKPDLGSSPLNRRIRNPLSNRVYKFAGQSLKVGYSFRLGGLAGTNLVRIVLDSYQAAKVALWAARKQMRLRPRPRA